VSPGVCYGSCTRKFFRHREMRLMLGLGRQARFAAARFLNNDSRSKLEPNLRSNTTLVVCPAHLR
jgi:hypothetical protein